MTRNELIHALAQRFPHLMIRDAECSVKELLEAMAASLVTGNRIEVRGFGSFVLSYRPPRKARNPKTGTAVEVPGKWTPHFKAGKDLRERVATVA